MPLAFSFSSHSQVTFNLADSVFKINLKKNNIEGAYRPFTSGLVEADLLPHTLPRFTRVLSYLFCSL